LQIGEAAGIIAALAVKNDIEPREVSVRDVQREVLNNNGYLLPFLDIPSSHPHFAAVQRIGVTGIMRGKGMTVGWENQTWFYTNEKITTAELAAGLDSYNPNYKYVTSNNKSHYVTLRDLASFCGDITAEQWAEWGLENYDPQRDLTRLECAVVLDARLKPFDNQNINIKGDFLR
jgi:hypothetical protein